MITIADDRDNQIKGDSAQTVSCGFLFAKVAKYLDRVYSPDRVLYPMRRVKPKGTGADGANAGEGARATHDRSFELEGRAGAPVAPPAAFERISWDEALDEIPHQFHHSVAHYRPHSILPT